MGVEERVRDWLETRPGSQEPGETGLAADLRSRISDALPEAIPVPGEPISPELVLVDPSLRGLIFATEPDLDIADLDDDLDLAGIDIPNVAAGDLGEKAGDDSQVSETALLLALGERAEVLPETEPARRRWPALAAAAVLGALATVGAGYAVVSVTGSGGRPAASAPRAGAQARTPAGAKATKPAAHAAKSVGAQAAKSPVHAAKARRSVPAATPRRSAPTGSSSKPHATRSPVERRPTPATGSVKGRARPALVPPTPTPRRFAWAPVAGATSYRVAVYHGDVPVFRAQTPDASIVIPQRTAKGSALLAPGTYKWYVWPVRNGHTASVAVVRSTFVVGSTA